MNLKKIKFGVIGCSRVAIKGMIPAILDSELAELSITGSRDLKKAEEVATRFSAKAWGAYEDVINNGDVDAVYVSLPNSMHEEWTIKALEAGKHVICEKPAAITYVAAKKMTGVAREKNVRLLEGLMFRYNPQNIKVVEFIKNGTLGGLLRFDGVFGYAMPDKSSNAMSRVLEGGSFNDQICYPVSASRMVFGEEPESVLCNIETDPESGVSLRADMMLMYSGSRSAFASSIFGSYYQSTYSVLGTKANIKMGRAYAVPRDMPTKVFLEENDKVEEIVFPPSDHFRFMVDDFCAEVMNGIDSKKDYEGNLLAQARILEAARTSSKEKRLVKISEIV